MNKALESDFGHTSTAEKMAQINSNNSNLKKLSQTLFKVLLKKDEAKYPTGSAQTISHRQGQLNDDIDRIEQLELCVSAARKTEGYDQYD